MICHFYDEITEADIEDAKEEFVHDKLVELEVRCDLLTMQLEKLVRVVSLMIDTGESSGGHGEGC